MAVPHTITNKEEFVACAYTQKVYKFCDMMTLRGHTVFHYGHADSCVPCTEHVAVITRETYKKVYGTDAHRTKLFSYDSNDEVYNEFYTNATIEIIKRKHFGDFVLAFWGLGNKPVCDAVNVDGDVIIVEPGIGYCEPFAGYRIYESYSLLHCSLGLDCVRTAERIPWYHTVIPNYFDPRDFEFNKNKKDYFLCLGRIGKAKGVDMAIQITEKIGARLIIAGQGGHGDVGLSEWPPHVEYVGYALPEKRKELMKNAKGLFILSTYIEPFGGAMIEAFFCGTPVISTDIGSFVENNLHGITGYRCRTFGQMVWAARNIHRIDPQACQNWAQNFTLDRIAPMYEEYFQSVYDGWYGDVNSTPLLPVKVFPMSAPKVAIWQSVNWAIGRITHAMDKYIPNSYVYDWLTSNEFWVSGKWKEYDYIISTTDLHRIEELYGIKPDPKKLIIISHCPKFDLSHFHERMDNIQHGSIYCGVSRETCKEMEKFGVKAAWTPFGADGDVFPLTHGVTGPIRRIGIINGNSTHEYIKIKGLEKFNEICRIGGFEPVSVTGKTSNLYENIDLYICCSVLEAGPLGIFEAASCGVPVMTTAVGNAQNIKGIFIFDTAQEAVDRINAWNKYPEDLRAYTEYITQEVRENWSMEILIKRHINPLISI